MRCAHVRGVNNGSVNVRAFKVPAFHVASFSVDAVPLNQAFRAQSKPVVFDGPSVCGCADET